MLAGCKTGTGLLIISGQLGKVLGVEQSGDNFFQKTWSAIVCRPGCQGWSFRTSALGAAYVGSGFFQGLPAGGGLSQTAVNDASGARTSFAGAVTAGVALVTVLFLTGLFETLPQASLGAVVIVAAAGLVDLDAITALGRIRGSAILLASVTVLGVLLLGVLDGVLIGVVAAMLSWSGD